MLPETPVRTVWTLRLPSRPLYKYIVVFVVLAIVSFGIAFGLTSYQTGQAKQASIYATQCSVATAKAENYVAIWSLYGTPTATISPTPRSTFGAIPPTMTATYLAAANATQVAMLGATFTPSPSPTAYAMIVGSQQRGLAVFEGKKASCYACHTTQSAGAVPDPAPDTALTGPPLAGIAAQGGNRVPGLSLEAYLRESIEQPDAYIVPGYAPRIMPRDYAQILAPQDIDDLIAYMMQLK